MKKTVSFAKNSVNFFFHILTSCNLNCQHCYINPSQHGNNTLSIKTIKNWLTLFADKAQKANVIFLGGEPTLHPDLAEAVKKACQLGYASITIDTNGYLFNDILYKIKPSEVDYISFSLDGATAHTNDLIRGKGSYQKCIAGIKQAFALGFSTSLIYTVNHANLHELEKMIPLIADLKIERFFIQVIGLRGNLALTQPLTPNQDKIAQVGADLWLKIIPRVATAAARMGIRVTYPKVYLRPDELFECAGLVAKNYFVFPNGRVYRCPICEDYPIHSLSIVDNKLTTSPKINEMDLFGLTIPQGCVMNKIIQPDNLPPEGKTGKQYKIACCLLKEEIS